MQTKSEYTPGLWELRGPTQVYGNHQRDQNSTGDRVAVTVTHADARLIAAAPELLTKVEIAATIFDEYARLHSAKGTADGDQKAKRNLEYAAEMRTAIARAKGQPSPHPSSQRNSPCLNRSKGLTRFASAATAPGRSAGTTA